MTNSFNLLFSKKFSNLDPKNHVEGEVIYVEDTQSIYVFHQGKFIPYNTIFNLNNENKKVKNTKKKKF